MLTTVKGTYTDGRIILHETPPIQEEMDVIVTFLNRRSRREKNMQEEHQKTNDLNGSLEINQPYIDKKGVRLGSWEGKYSIPDNFNDPLDDLADYM